MESHRAARGSFRRHDDGPMRGLLRWHAGFERLQSSAVFHRLQRNHRCEPDQADQKSRSVADSSQQALRRWPRLIPRPAAAGQWSFPRRHTCLMSGFKFGLALRLLLCDAMNPTAIGENVTSIYEFDDATWIGSCQDFCCTLISFFIIKSTQYNDAVR